MVPLGPRDPRTFYARPSMLAFEAQTRVRAPAWAQFSPIVTDVLLRGVLSVEARAAYVAAEQVSCHLPPSTPFQRALQRALL